MTMREELLDELQRLAEGLFPADGWEDPISTDLLLWAQGWHLTLLDATGPFGQDERGHSPWCSCRNASLAFWITATPPGTA